MKRIKKALLLLAFLLGLNQAAHSSHLAGGEFKVTWVTGNTFHVTLKMFRDCNPGSSSFPGSFTVGVYDNVTNALLQTFVLPLGPVSNITLGDECYSPPSTVCIQEGIYEGDVTFIPNPNGYYMTTQICCRNSSIDNISAPGSTSFLFYTQIPDVTYQNSTPDFGPYPTEGYLCLGLENNISFPVTEIDGDSLVYSLITPIEEGFGSFGGTGSWPKPFTDITWQPPYNLADIVGGTPPMSIDPVTGVITCYPNTSGVFAFAVKIEEWRAGVKIGEVVRDIQYFVLPCVIDDLPEIMLPDTLNVYQDSDPFITSEACFDIVVIDADVTDTISILVESPITFADGATLTMPDPYSIVGTDTTYMFYFVNETTGLPDSIQLPRPIDSAGAFYGIGAIGLHYCWTTECADIVNSPFELEVSAFSLGCSGDTNFTNQTTQIVVLPEPIDNQVINLPDTISVFAGEQPCFDIVVLSTSATDTVWIQVESPSFPEGAILSQPSPVSTGPNMYEYFYWNDSTGAVDSVILPEPVQTGNIYSTPNGGVGLRYCWQTTCQDILTSPFEVTVTTFAKACNGDTISLSRTAIINIDTPPFPEQEIFLPPTINVYAGEEPCFDFVVLSENPTDTVMIDLAGSTIPAGAILSLPAPVSPGMYEFFYWNPTTAALDSVILPAATQTGPTSYLSPSGGIGLRFCWQTTCEDILVSPFNFQVTAFDPGCNGDTSFVTQSVLVNITPPPYPVQNIYIPPVINVNSGDEPCFDIVVLSENPTDTVNIVPSGPTFPAGAVLTQPAPVSPGMYEYFFFNPTTGQQDSVILAAPTVNGPVYTGLGGVGLHYCWQTTCADVDVSPFTIDVMAFDPGCNGDTSFINQTTIVNISPVIPPNQNVYLPDSLVLLAQDGTCFDAVILSQSATDTVTALISSPSFDAGAAVSTSSSNYVYWNPSISDFDTIPISGATPLGNGHYMGIGGIGLHYCWTTDCEDISDQEYLIRVAAYRIGCYGDTSFVNNYMTITVEAPEGISGVVPNVFTPNGDGVNDIFKLGGLWNYCYDTINVKIFNRWGQLVYQSDSPTFTWDGKDLDGKDLSEGVYYVLLNGIFGDADVTRHYSVNLFRNK